ncbi:MAG: peptidylprolyl isomerase [Bacteroidota bacterium]
MHKVLLLITLFIINACNKPQQTEKTYQVGQIKTPKGEMLFWLHDATPTHKAGFIKLANANYWDSLTFNRVIEGFVIQGGCPDTPAGFSDSPYLLAPEFIDSLTHQYGAVGAGRDNNPEKLSAGCQFYIVHDKDGIDRLDGNYTIFGQVFKGLDVLDAIATVETDTLDAPLTPIPLDVDVLSLTAEELKVYGYVVQN